MLFLFGCSSGSENDTSQSEHLESGSNTYTLNELLTLEMASVERVILKNQGDGSQTVLEEQETLMKVYTYLDTLEFVDDVDEALYLSGFKIVFISNNTENQPSIQMVGNTDFAYASIGEDYYTIKWKDIPPIDFMESIIHEKWGLAENDTIMFSALLNIDVSDIESVKITSGTGFTRDVLATDFETFVDKLATLSLEISENDDTQLPYYYVEMKLSGDNILYHFGIDAHSLYLSSAYHYHIIDNHESFYDFIKNAHNR